MTIMPSLSSRPLIRTILILAGLCLTAPVLAAETPPPATSGAPAPEAPATEPAPLPPPPAVRDFAATHPQCAEITDACIVCKVEGETINCSTPAIACIKGDLVCRKEKSTP